MRVNIIQIGNSKGLRLSKTILEKYAIGDKVNIRLEEKSIVIEPIKEPRAGWDKTFQKMKVKGDDALLIPDVWTEEKWPEWK